MPTDNTTMIHKVRVKSEGCTGKLSINDERTPSETPLIQPSEWKEFCDKINKALNSLHLGRVLSLMGRYTFITVLFTYVLLRILAGTGVVRSHVMYEFFYYVERAFFTSFFIVFLFIGCYSGGKARETLIEIDEICEDYTNKLKKNGVSFTFTFNVEALTAEDIEGSWNTEMKKQHLLSRKPSCYVKVKFPCGRGNGNVDIEDQQTQTLAQRLAELDEAKPYLTEDEYNMKRQDILGLTHTVVATAVQK